MEPAITVAALAAVFTATHIILATSRIRAALVRRLGERGFLTAFSLVAALAFGVLVHFYALHRFEGAAGLALGVTWSLRIALVAVVVTGMLLIAGALGAFPGSAYAFGNQNARLPHGLERITRHPFLIGTAMVAGAHALLATRLVGTVFLLGLVVLALAGSWHQDHKLRTRRGAPFAEFLAVTSVVPFAAILSGRQKLVIRELPWTAFAVAVPIIIWLRAVHDGIFSSGGAWVIATVLAGATVIMVQDFLAERRRARRAAVVPVAASRSAH